MNQKLPAVVAALALLVVIGVWWQTSGGPPTVLLESDAPHQEDSARAPTAKRMQAREDLRSKRDAWVSAHEQKRATQRLQSPPGDGADERGDAAHAVKGQVEATPRAGAAKRAMQEEAPIVGHEDSADDDGPEEIEDLKRTAMSDPDPDERINALWSLSVSDEDEALPVLSNALRDENNEVRLAAVQELGGLENERAAVDALSSALADSDAEVRAEAVRVIGDTDDPRALSLAKRLEHDPDPDVREEAQAVVEAAE